MVALFILSLFLIVSFSVAFKATRFGSNVATKSNTQLYEDFRLERTKGVFADGVYSEKQLREYTATYSNDERVDFLTAVGSLFGVVGNLLPKPVSKLEGSTKSSKIESNLKGTISPAVLEERTKAYVNGKLDAGKFYAALKTCFGDKVTAVLPEIINSLPASKQAGLKKFLK